MRTLKQLLFIFVLSIPLLSWLECTGAKGECVLNDNIQTVSSLEHFNTIIENAGNRLIAFDLYADWCMPCQILAPTLDEIARENRTLITIFKVNTDQFPQISEAFGATGIPFVVFIKNKKAIYALMGVQSKDSYQKIINTFADTSSNFKAKPNNKGPDGHRIKSGKSSGIHYQTKSPIHDPCYFII